SRCSMSEACVPSVSTDRWRRGCRWPTRGRDTLNTPNIFRCHGFGITILNACSWPVLVAAALNETGHEHAFNIVIPKPWHLKIFGVFKVSLPRVGQRHPRLHRSVETEGTHASLIEHLD